jgi:hypothetical protein
MISLSQNAHSNCNRACASVARQRPLFALQFFLPLFSLARLTHSGPMTQDQGLKTATGAGSVRNCRIDRSPCELPGAQRSAAQLTRSDPGAAHSLTHSLRAACAGAAFECRCTRNGIFPASSSSRRVRRTVSG